MTAEQPVAAELPPCPECASEFAYEAGALLTCPMCGHEWSPEQAEQAAESAAGQDVVLDANGNPLADGDAVLLVKSVRIAGGGGGTLKVGTRVRNIRLVADRGDGHDIDARLPDIGKLQLKSSVVKKA